MTIAILIGHFPPGPFGGAELQAEAWAERLASTHRVIVITRCDPPGQPAREQRGTYEVRRVPIGRWPVWRTVRDLGAIEAAIRTLDPKPDVLLCFQTFISGLAGVRLQKRLGIPAVVWIRGEAEIRLGSSWFSRLVNPRVWSAARGVLVQSDEVRGELLREWGAVSRSKAADLSARLVVVPNGIDLPALEPGPRRSGGRVLAVGRLIADKAIDTVIDAVAGVQGLLTIAGEGPERGALETRARRHDLDVRFEGFVDSARLATLYREASAFVLAARRGEGFPNVVLEAMAHGCPVVATTVTGVRELVEDGVNGLLVPPGDPLALRDALARLGHERGLAERLGTAGRTTAERYAWPRVVPRLETALQQWTSA